MAICLLFPKKKFCPGFFSWPFQGQNPNNTRSLIRLVGTMSRVERYYPQYLVTLTKTLAWPSPYEPGYVYKLSLFTGSLKVKLTKIIGINVTNINVLGLFQIYIAYMS